MKLSYRDKIILTVAVIVITLVLGIFLIIKPAITTFNANQATLTAKQQEMADIDAKIAAAQNIDQKITDAYKEGVKLADFFLPQMNTYETDQFLLPYVSANNITINSLSLSEPEAVPMENYMYELKKPQYPLLEASDLNGELDYNTIVGEAEEYQNVVKITAVLDCKIKDMEALYGLLDDIDNLSKSVIVRSVEHGEGEDDQQGASGSISIDFYSVRQISEPNLD